MSISEYKDPHWFVHFTQFDPPFQHILLWGFQLASILVIIILSILFYFQFSHFQHVELWYYVPKESGSMALHPSGKVGPETSFSVFPNFIAFGSQVLTGMFGLTKILKSDTNSKRKTSIALM